MFLQQFVSNFIGWTWMRETAPRPLGLQIHPPFCSSLSIKILYSNLQFTGPFTSATNWQVNNVHARNKNCYVLTSLPRGLCWACPRTRDSLSLPVPFDDFEQSTDNFKQKPKSHFFTSELIDWLIEHDAIVIIIIIKVLIPRIEREWWRRPTLMPARMCMCVTHCSTTGKYQINVTLQFLVHPETLRCWF